MSDDACLKNVMPLTAKRRIRALLVEDDVVDRMACRRALQQHPSYEFELVEADTGRQGVQMALADEFDCILLDYHLPDMSGLEFLTEIADALGKIQVPVLKLTSTDNVAIAVEAMKRGARDYLIKDTEGRYLELLPAVIERVLEEQRALEEKFHAEMKYQALVEHTPSITYILSLEGEGRPLYVSPQIERLGFTPEEWIRDSGLHSEQVLPEDRDLVMRAFMHSCRTGEVFRCDYRMATRNGDVLWFHDEAKVVCDEKGKMLFLQGIMLDITEKKSIEKELTEHRYRLEQQVERRTAMLERRNSILESANSNLCDKLEQNIPLLMQARLAKQRCQTLHALVEEAIFDVDTNGVVTYLNPAAERLLKISEGQALGHPLSEILKLVCSSGLSVEDIQRRCLTWRHESVRVETGMLLREGQAACAVSGWFAPIVNTDGQTVSILVLLYPAGIKRQD